MGKALREAPQGCMTRRELQPRFWRLGAHFFDYVLSNLLSEGRITEYQGWLYGIPRDDFQAAGWFNASD